MGLGCNLDDLGALNGENPGAGRCLGELSMRLFLTFLMLLTSWRAQASGPYSVQIEHIDSPIKGESLLMLSDGKVAWVSDRDVELRQALQSAALQKSWLHLKLNQQRFVLSAQSVPSPESYGDESEMSPDDKSILFTPTVLPDLDAAQEYFKRMNPHYKDKSQCYNRAHVWAWEMYKHSRLQSQKVFIFFPVKYIRQFKFEWWFHVTPMVSVMEKGKVTERTMDYRYAKGPLLMKNWTDIFMRNNAECPVITRYSQFEQDRNNPNGPWCMLFKASMYYYQPLDLAALENRHKMKMFWQEGEIINAYAEAFEPGQRP